MKKKGGKEKTSTPLSFFSPFSQWLVRKEDEKKEKKKETNKQTDFGSMNYRGKFDTGCYVEKIGSDTNSCSRTGRMVPFLIAKVWNQCRLPSRDV